MKYILDTNTCIYIIKQKPASVLDRFKSIPLGQIGISVITLAELEYGSRKSSNPEKNLIALHQFLIPFEIFNFDYEATSEYGIIRSDLEKKAHPLAR
jgi:tRNA(fMet)-specific endonuclease VapC